MNKNRIYSKSFILLIVIILTFSFSFLTNAEAPTHEFIFDNKEESEKMSNTLKSEAEREKKAKQIDDYYARYNLPLSGYGRVFVQTAEKYDIDWKLVAAIAFIESTGGKFDCVKATFNPFGWGSCRIGFDSYEDAIDIVSKNLAGENPRTESYYAGKDIKGILQSYNPPSIVPDYAQKVMREMGIIDNM